MHPNDWLHNLESKGGRQLTEAQWKELFWTIDGYGILADQPNETEVTSLGDSAELIYFPEVRSESIDMEYSLETNDSWVDKDKTTVVDILDAIWFHTRRKNSGDLKGELDGNGILGYEILLVGVNYPANPLILIPDERGMYMISTSRYEKLIDQNTGKKTIRVDELNKLAKNIHTFVNLPISHLKQSDPDVWSHSDNRYYEDTRFHEGHNYGKGHFMDTWQSSGFDEGVRNMLIESLDTNGHIFFVIGKPTIIRPSYNSINTQVID